MADRVTHFEIPSSDPQKTMKFFTSVFGWTFTQMGNEEYWMADTGKKGPGINGAIMRRRHEQQPITNSITVESIDDKMRKVADNGGEVVVEKTAVPGMGWFAFFKDPDGYIHGLWQDDAKAGS